MKKLCLSIAVALFPLGAQVISQTTIHLNPVEDAALYESHTAYGNGAGDWLFAGLTNQNSPRRSLIQFDLSSIPANANIRSATLTLFKDKGNGSGHTSLHRVTTDWLEGSANATEEEGQGTNASSLGGATWSHAVFNLTAWSALGGDFLIPARASAEVGSANGPYSWSSANLASDVAAWMLDPSNNHGWMIIGDESADPNSTARFRSRENPQNPPVLSVTYTLGCPSINALSGIIPSGIYRASLLVSSTGFIEDGSSVIFDAPMTRLDPEFKVYKGGELSVLTAGCN